MLADHKRFYLNSQSGKALCVAIGKGLLDNPPGPFRPGSEPSAHELNEAGILLSMLGEDLRAGRPGDWDFHVSGGHPNGTNLIGMIEDRGDEFRIWFHHQKSVLLASGAEDCAAARSAVLSSPRLAKDIEEEARRMAIAAERRDRGEEFAARGDASKVPPPLDLGVVLIESWRRRQERGMADAERAIGVVKERLAGGKGRSLKTQDAADVAAFEAALDASPRKGWAAAIQIEGGCGLLVPIVMSEDARQPVCDALAWWGGLGHQERRRRIRTDSGDYESWDTPESIGDFVAVPAEEIPFDKSFYTQLLGRKLSADRAVPPEQGRALSSRIQELLDGPEISDPAKARTQVQSPDSRSAPQPASTSPAKSSAKMPYLFGEISTMERIRGGVRGDLVGDNGRVPYIAFGAPGQVMEAIGVRKAVNLLGEPDPKFDGRYKVRFALELKPKDRSVSDPDRS